MEASAIIVAAGQGKRMGAEHNKLLLPLHGEPIILHTLARFDSLAEIKEIILVVAEWDEPVVREMVDRKGLKTPLLFARGGRERADSVREGLRRVSLPYVLVHDGARPLTLPEDIRRVAWQAKASGAAVLGVPVKDTVKRTDADFCIVETPARERVWLAQTPQAFATALLREAYRALEAQESGLLGPAALTDDASVVERYGHRVILVPGSEENLKVTLPQDIVLADWILQRRRRQSRD